jgi:hypothetical protein
VSFHKCDRARRNSARNRTCGKAGQVASRDARTLVCVLIRERLANRVLAVDEPVMTIWSRISVPHLLPAYDGLIAAGTRSWHDCCDPQCVGLPARRSGRYRSVVPVNHIGFSARSFHAKAGSDYIVRERPAHGVEIHSGRIVNTVSIVCVREPSSWPGTNHRRSSPAVPAAGDGIGA